MLELDMRLDADLGIDSIKRVEILSALQDRLPDPPPIGPEHTGTLQTLRHVVEFLSAASRPEPYPMGEPVPRASDVHRNGTVVGARPSRETLHPPARGGWPTQPATDPSVVLRRLQPRAVPMLSPDRRETVPLRAGGSIWVTDDGSPL